MLQSDKTYPHLLRQIYCPPAILYYRGDLNVPQKTCVSIVGTRKNSDYGEYVVNELVRELAILDIAIVSGLASGIDTLAHKAALKHGLPTIAVLGSGIDNIYPKENQKLAEEIIKSGLILSEYPGENEPTRQTFPARNRIISGLSVVTVIIEACEKSGALITAKLALDQNRDVFAVPGDIDRPESRGPLNLLKNPSAYPLTSPQDLIEYLRKQAPLFQYEPARDKFKKIPKNDYLLKLDNNERKIFNSIALRRSIPFEKIMERTKLQAEIIFPALSTLEIRGLVKNLNGQYYRTC